MSRQWLPTSPRRAIDWWVGWADYIDGKRVAVVVYEHGPHIINVFTWASQRGSYHASPPATATTSSSGRRGTWSTALFPMPVGRSCRAW